MTIKYALGLFLAFVLIFVTVLASLLAAPLLAITLRLTATRYGGPFLFAKNTPIQ